MAAPGDGDPWHARPSVQAGLVATTIGLLLTCIGLVVKLTLYVEQIRQDVAVLQVTMTAMQETDRLLREQVLRNEASIDRLTERQLERTAK
jgi:hypothetical protein